MKVRTLIPKRLDPMDDPAHATVIANLVSAGFRLVGPDELDPATVERCAQVAELTRDGFLSPQYATNQPAGSFCERFACDEVARSIRTLTGGNNGR